MYNATWTAAELRGRRNDSKWSSTAPPPPQIEFTPSTTTMDGSYSNTDAQGGSMPLDMELQMPQSSSFEYQFPWGVWNDALFDALELGGGSQLYPDGSLPMYNLI
jgi:hypothetical protein